MPTRCCGISVFSDGGSCRSSTFHNIRTSYPQDHLDSRTVSYYIIKSCSACCISQSAVCRILLFNNGSATEVLRQEWPGPAEGKPLFELVRPCVRGLLHRSEQLCVVRSLLMPNGSSEASSLLLSTLLHALTTRRWGRPPRRMQSPALLWMAL